VPYVPLIPFYLFDYSNHIWQSTNYSSSFLILSILLSLLCISCTYSPQTDMLSICLWLCSPSVGPWPLFQFLNLYAVGRTPWLGDQPVARPLPTHRTTQTQNKLRETSMPWVRFEPTIPVLERAKTVHALDRAATVIGSLLTSSWNIQESISLGIYQYRFIYLWFPLLWSHWKRLYTSKKHFKNSVALVRKRTIPTERPPLVVEVSANLCG
jgi:hypothetical protein